MRNLGKPFCFSCGNTPGYSAASTAPSNSFPGKKLFGADAIPSYLCWRRNQQSWVHPTEFWFLTNGLNLQAVIFLLHGRNINFLNFQVGNNQTDTTFYQQVCSKIPEKKSLILDWNHHLNWSISGVFKTSRKNIFKGYWIKSQHLTLKGKQRSRHWSWKQKLTDVFACPGMVLHSRNPRDVQETEVNQGRVSWHAQQKE